MGLGPPLLHPPNPNANSCTPQLSPDDVLFFCSGGGGGGVAYHLHTQPLSTLRFS